MRLAPVGPRATALAALLVVGTVVSTLAGPAATATAGPEDTKRQVDRSIQALTDDLDDTSADLVTAYAALQRTQGLLPAARDRLATAEAEVEAAADADRDLAARLAVSVAAEGKAADELAGTARDVDQTSVVIGDIARQAYQSGGMGELSVALQASSADDFATRVVLVDTAIRIQTDTLTRLAVLRADTSAARLRLTAVRRQTALLRAQAAAALVRAERVEAAAAAAKAEVDGLVATRTAQVAAVESRKAGERRRLDALQAQSRQLQAQLAQIARAARARAAKDAAARAAAEARAREASSRKASAAATPRAVRAPSSSSGSSGSGGSGGFTSSGYLSAPVPGARVSSEFGRRFHPILHYWRLHAGIDFAVACGTPVHAAADGRVVSAGWGGGYGNRIVVDHGLVGSVGLATTYNHLSRIVVHGGSVNRGQLIGYSGTTGSSTGCHLHFETYDDGTPVNPRRWF